MPVVFIKSVKCLIWLDKGSVNFMRNCFKNFFWKLVCEDYGKHITGL